MRVGTTAGAFIALATLGHAVSNNQKLRKRMHGHRSNQQSLIIYEQDIYMHAPRGKPYTHVASICLFRAVAGKYVLFSPPYLLIQARMTGIASAT